ncbi:MAG: hypothetical protein HY869_09575 [Chloroflexi bacterium]|nr:hypothetical protein [Chloroflexota bacterium]
MKFSGQNMLWICRRTCEGGVWRGIVAGVFPFSILLLLVITAACSPAPLPPDSTGQPSKPTSFATPTLPAMATGTFPADTASASILFSMNYGNADRAIASAFIAPYGNALVVMLDDGQVQILHLEEEMAAAFWLPFEFPFQENAVSVQPGRILFAEYFADENGDITLWQVLPGNEAVVVAAISATDAFVTSLAFSPDGETLAVGFNVGEIRLYDTRDGASLRVIPAFNDFVESMSYSQDGRHIIADSFSFDPNTYVFDVESGEKLATLSTESWEPGRVSFSLDGKLAAATGGDGTHIFTTSDWQATGLVIAGVWDGTFTCDGRGFMHASGGLVDIYSLGDGLRIGTLNGGPFYCLADGRTVAIDLDDEAHLLTLRVVDGLVGIQPGH